MIPFHIAYASANAQGQPIDPATIGDVYWEGWNLHYTGPDDAGLVRKMVSSGQTTQVQPASVTVGAFDADGTLVGFYATATPLVAGDTNGFSDAYALWSNTYQQLTNGDGPTSSVQYVSAGANGFRGGVAFESTATNLIGGDTNGASDIFVRTYMSGGYEPAIRVSTTSTGGEANGASYNLIAADFRPMILFQSDATNLLGDGQGGVFWKDLGTGVLKRVDATADGARITGITDLDISAYGRFVVFASDTSSAVSGDTNGVGDIFMKDMETGAVSRVSTGPDGAQLDFAAGNPTIDPEGRYVAFEGRGQIWVKDLQSGELLQLTDSAGANHIVGFQGNQLLFRNDGGVVVEGVSSGGLFVASLGAENVLRSGVTATSSTFTIPDGIDQAYIRGDIGGYVITGNALGNLFTGTDTGNTFIGAGGDDVFKLGRGGNTLTGGEGFDTYIAAFNPYAPGTITDFRIGEDELDMSVTLAGRGGNDPTVDGYIRFEADGAGGTRVLYDPDGSAGTTSGVFHLFVLKNVPASTVTWTNVTNREGAAGDETPFISFQPGGASSSLIHANVSEAALRWDGASVGPGAFYVRAGDGIDDLTVDGRAILTDGVFQAASWTTPLGNRIEFVGYDPSNGKVSFNYDLLQKAYHPYAGGLGDDRIYEDMAVVLTDRDGDRTTATLHPSIQDDRPSLSSDLDIVDRNVGRSSGNVIAGVRDAETQHSSGVDIVPIDGGAIGRIEAVNTFTSDDTPDAGGDFTVEGAYGTLTMNRSGDYTYVLRGDAPSSGAETFRYWMKDGDGRPLTDQTSLEIRFSPDAPGADGGQVITSPGPSSTVTGGPGDDTLNASNGADTLTGGAGSDVFAWAQAPTGTARITDFRVDYSSDGDRIDLSRVLQAAGYTGSDPSADGYIRLVATDGGSHVLFDRDGPTGPATGEAIIKLDNIPATTSWSYIGGGSDIYFWASPQTLTRAEGDSGPSAFTFTITRNNGAMAGEGSVTWATSATGTNPAAGSDFVGGAFPGGTVAFAAGETSKTITIEVAGDTVVEPEETFLVTLTGSTGGRVQDYRPTGRIGNDDGAAPPPPPADGGQVLTSPGPGSTLTGGAGADTLNASQGSDTLTGGGGGDVFRWGREPWSPATVTDFAVGRDRLDLSALFQASGYTGSDPVADRYISLTQQGADTLVLFDRDATGAAQQWPNYIIKLQGVSNITWSQLSGGGTSGPAPSVVQITPASVSHAEGQSGVTAYSFTLTRSGDLNRFETTYYQVAGSGGQPADASDFRSGYLPNASFTWEKGEASRTITVEVAGDTVAEGDESFVVRLTANAQGTAVGANGSATGLIVNDDGSPGGGTPGQVYTSPGPGSTVAGGAGDDTLNASRGADVLTGNGGADVFAWADVPWSAARVTDFTAGMDRVDLSGVFQDIGYAGSDPVADGYVILVNSFDMRSTHLYVDADGPGSAHQWDGFTVTLEGLYGGGTAGSRSSLSWTDVAGTGQPGGGDPPPAEGRVLTAQQNGDTLTGGAGPDTLNASQGPDRLTGGEGDDHFVFARLVWNSGVVTDFAPGHDRVDLSGLFDVYAQGVVEARAGGGGTEIYFDQDGASGEWPTKITTLSGVTPDQLGSGWLIQ